MAKNVKEYIGHYQYERAKTFGVSQSIIFYALKHLNISNKKRAIVYPDENEFVMVHNSNTIEKK